MGRTEDWGGTHGPAAVAWHVLDVVGVRDASEVVDEPGLHQNSSDTLQVQMRTLGTASSHTKWDSDTAGQAVNVAPFA